jgi:hypothetical protein
MEDTKTEPVGIPCNLQVLEDRFEDIRLIYTGGGRRSALGGT